MCGCTQASYRILSVCVKYTARESKIRTANLAGCAERICQVVRDLNNSAHCSEKTSVEFEFRTDSKGPPLIVSYGGRLAI